MTWQLVYYAQNLESTLSSLGLFFGCPEASFVGVHKICLVRFYLAPAPLLPRERTQEIRGMALGPLGRRREEFHFPNQNPSLAGMRRSLEKGENMNFSISCKVVRVDRLTRGSTCTICLTYFTDQFDIMYTQFLFYLHQLFRELHWAFHSSSSSSYFLLTRISKSLWPWGKLVAIWLWPCWACMTVGWSFMCTWVYTEPYCGVRYGFVQKCFVRLQWDFLFGFLRTGCPMLLLFPLLPFWAIEVKGETNAVLGTCGDQQVTKELVPIFRLSSLGCKPQWGHWGMKPLAAWIPQTVILHVNTDLGEA